MSTTTPQLNVNREGQLARCVAWLALPVLFVVSRYNFLLFHTLAELFGVVVAYAVFALAWNSRRFLDNNYLLSLGLAFPFVGGLHLIHALGYKGMGVFEGYDTYIATQVWIVARFTLAVSFLIAPAFLGRRLNVSWVVVCWTAATVLLLLALFFWGLFPPLFVEGKGLTPLKRQCEHVVSAMLLASLVPLYLKRACFAPQVLRMLVGAVLAALATEVPFTLYNNVYDWINAIGHLVSILSFYLVYQALVVTGMQQPHELLFRNLKQREEALERSEARLKLALEAGGLATFDWIVAEDQMEWSDAYYRLLGHSVGEVPPGLDTLRRRLHPEDRDRYEADVREAMELHEEHRCEFRIIRPDESMHWLESRGRFVYDSAGKPLRLFGVVSDVTARKELEAERQNLLEAERAARTEAERVNRMKDEFLATVSHELRSPLNAIVGWARLLAGGRVEPSRAADVIDRSATSLNQIVEDLLDMSRIVSGKIRLRREEVDLLEIVAAVSDSVRFTAQRKQVHLEVTCAPEPVPLECDPSRVQQILWNLLSNAIKFTPEGGRVEVNVSQSPNQVRLEIRDTGKGIDPAFLPHVFERFRQQDGGVARYHGGLGLGLAIVKNLVELHGGTVEARSDGEGRGATFLVVLPRFTAQEESPACERARRSPVPLPIAGLNEYTLKGVRVLAVDDEVYNLELLARILSDAGATVRTAQSAAQGSDALEEFRPDVLISDIGMPGEDGFSFIRRLRSAEGWPARMPCVAVTALSRPEDRERALSLGFNEHVGKPFDPGQLCLLIARLLGRTAGTDSPDLQPDGGTGTAEAHAEEANGGTHILLAEDDACIAEMFKTVLELEGYRVSLTDSAAQAVHLAEAQHFDLLVSDLILADGAAWDMLTRLNRTRPVPGIALSGYGEPEYADRSKAAGFSEYLIKPVDADDLIAAVKRTLSQQRDLLRER